MNTITLRRNILRLSEELDTKRTWNILIVCLLGLMILPVWLYPYFPSQDGPSHLYNAKVLLQYFDHSNFQLRYFFDIHFSLIPNNTAQWVLALLVLFFDPLIAQQLMFSIMIVLLPLSVIYIGSHFDKKHNLLIIGSFIFAHNYFLQMGFFGYSLGMPVCLFTIGYWLRIRSDLTLLKMCGFFTLGYLTFLTHFLPFAVMLAVTGGIFLYDFAGLVFRRVFPGKLHNEATVGMHSLQDGLIQGFMILPFLFLTGYIRTYIPPRVTPASGGGFSYKGSESLVQHVVDNLSMVSYTGVHTAVVTATWSIVIAAIAVNIVVRVINRKFRSPRDVILVACGVLVFLYFTQPSSGLGGGWINERILLIAMPLSFLWYERFPRPIALIFGVLFAAVSVWQVQLFSREYALLQPELKELTAAVDLIEPHSTLSYEFKGSYFDSMDGHTKRISPLLHMAAYYGLKKDIAYIGNYEAGWGYFMVNWVNRPPRRFKADYVLQSRHDADEHDQKMYDLVFHSPTVKLLKRKRQVNKDGIWATLPDGRIQLSLNFGRQDGSSRPGEFGVSTQKAFEAGGFGWVNKLKSMKGRRKAGNKPSLSRVQSLDDAAFRVELPSGKYTVTYFFGQNNGGRRQINIIANDQAVVRNLILEPSDKQHEESHQVDVSGQYLDQVFYTKWKRGMRGKRLPYWSISGMRIVSEKPVSMGEGTQQYTGPQSSNATFLLSEIPQFQSIKISRAFNTLQEQFGRTDLDIADAANDRNAGWKSLDLIPDWQLNLNFAEHFEFTNDQSVYVAAEVEVSEAISVALSSGSDDGVTIWLNGEKLLEKLVLRGAVLGDDKLKLELKAGRNEILFRVNNAGGGWHLVAKIHE